MRWRPLDVSSGHSTIHGEKIEKELVKRGKRNMENFLIWRNVVIDGEKREEEKVSVRFYYFFPKHINHWI